jgi:predicted lipid-binding transport protein (Tim44 family)
MYADKSFTVESFLSGAEKAFKIIVSSYKEKNIDNAEKLLSPKVLKAFQEQTEIKNDIQSFKITKLKASIINIEIVKKLAKVKVKFLSTQKNTYQNKDETVNVKDIWTFEKIIGSNDPTWVLSEVTSE